MLNTDEKKELNALWDSFDYQKDKFLLNPAVFENKDVKILNWELYEKVLGDIEEYAVTSMMFGPSKALG